MAGALTIGRSVAAYAGMAAGFAAGVVLALVTRDRRSGAERGLALGSDLALALAGVRVRVQGTENLWARRPALYVINHQSPLDPLIMGKVLRGRFTGVVKKEVAQIPVAGAFLRFAGFAFVDRGNTAQAKAALAPAVERLRAGVSLAIAPEGTRSATLGPFKKGAFHVAMQAGAPIVPVVIRNAGEVQPEHSKTIRPGTVHVVVHPPIAVDGWTVERLDQRVAEVHDIFERTLAP